MAPVLLLPRCKDHILWGLNQLALLRKVRRKARGDKVGKDGAV